MGLLKIASAANAGIEVDALNGNDYTLIINVNGVAPVGSTAVVTVKPHGSTSFEDLEENGTVDLTAPKTIKIGYACGTSAFIDAIKITPNSTFTDDLTSSFDALLDVILIGRPV